MSPSTPPGTKMSSGGSCACPEGPKGRRAWEPGQLLSEQSQQPQEVSVNRVLRACLSHRGPRAIRDQIPTGLALLRIAGKGGQVFDAYRLFCYNGLGAERVTGGRANPG